MLTDTRMFYLVFDQLSVQMGIYLDKRNSTQTLENEDQRRNARNKNNIASVTVL